jgi:hypothetical protein
VRQVLMKAWSGRGGRRELLAPQLAERTGLPVETVDGLLGEGWSYVEWNGQPGVWTPPGVLLGGQPTGVGRVYPVVAIPAGRRVGPLRRADRAVRVAAHREDTVCPVPDCPVCAA